MAREPKDIADLRRALGEQLMAFRKAAKLYQDDLARAVHLDRTTVAHIEKGRSRADERFWRIADDLCHANGTLLVSFHQLEAAKLRHDQHTLDTRQAEARAKAHRMVPLDGSQAARAWRTPDVVRRLYRTHLGSATVEQLHIATEEMCCEYAWRDAAELLSDARAQLRYISTLLDGPCTLREHRELLVQAGWLMLLAGCIEYDTGQYRHAEQSRRAAFQIGEETGHGEIIAWSFEMLSWFALTQGNLKSVTPHAEAGMKAAPHSSVVVQLAAQAAKAAARMGQRKDVHQILDEGYRLLGYHDRPHRPENHFVIDPQKWDFYAMDCYRLVREDKRAADHAREVLRISRRPDGTDSSPMRATEARLTLAMVSARQGDLDVAAEWTAAALGAQRKSIDQLMMITAELEHELHRLFPSDPATRTITEPINQAKAELRG